MSQMPIIASPNPANAEKSPFKPVGSGLREGSRKTGCHVCNGGTGLCTTSADSPRTHCDRGLWTLWSTNCHNQKCILQSTNDYVRPRTVYSTYYCDSLVIVPKWVRQSLNFAKLRKVSFFSNDCPILRGFWAKLGRVPLQTNIDSDPGLDTGGRGNTRSTLLLGGPAGRNFSVKHDLLKEVTTRREFHELDSGWEETPWTCVT